MGVFMLIFLTSLLCQYISCTDVHDEDVRLQTLLVEMKQHQLKQDQRLGDLDQKLVDQDQKLMRQGSELVQLRGENDLQNKQLIYQDKQLVDQDQQLVDQDQQLGVVKQILSMQDHKIQLLEHENAEEGKKVHGLEHITDHLTTALSQHQTDMVQAISDMTGQSTVGVIAFNIKRTTSYTEGSVSNPIPFDLYRVNTGPGLDPVTSVFTAPVPGYYFFTLTLTLISGALDSWIMLNEEYYMHADARHVLATTSTSGIMYLVAGDAVYVQISPSQTLRCGATDECMFSGFLLHETLL